MSACEMTVSALAQPCRNHLSFWPVSDAPTRRGHQIVGTQKDVSDLMKERFIREAAGGLTMNVATVLQRMRQFVEMVRPQLTQLACFGLPIQAGPCAIIPASIGRVEASKFTVGATFWKPRGTSIHRMRLPTMQDVGDE